MARRRAFPQSSLARLDAEDRPVEHPPVAYVELSAHLRDLFPELGSASFDVPAGTVGQLIDELERRRPGIAFYLCDELGRLRRHVNVFVDGEMIIDRPKLSDPLGTASMVFIAQALSGG